MAEPYQLDRKFKGKGPNKKALAFYLNEGENRLKSAIDYYLHKRTIPPDTNALSIRMGCLAGYISNYTRSKAPMIDAIRKEAIRGFNITSPTREKVDEYIERCRKVLHDNLPPKYIPSELKEFERMLGRCSSSPRSRSFRSLTVYLTRAYGRKERSSMLLQTATHSSLRSTQPKGELLVMTTNFSSRSPAGRGATSG